MDKYYTVYITVDISGLFVVKADDIEEAKLKAKEQAFNSAKELHPQWDDLCMHPVHDTDVKEIK